MSGILYSIFVFVCESVITGIVIAGVVYYAAYKVSWSRGWKRVPAVAAILAFGICIFTLPSIPRYAFASDVGKAVAYMPGYRLVLTNIWSNKSEPLTLIKAPINRFRVATPDLNTYTKFTAVDFVYGKEPKATEIEANCQTKNTSEAGSLFQIPMTEEEFSAYCLSNWTKERNERLKQIQSK